jgi:hypothetical protein
VSLFKTVAGCRCGPCRQAVARTAGVIALTVAALAGAAPGADASPVNLALNTTGSGFPSPAESDPGWGGGARPWDIVDGAHSYDDWAHGLAFTGGRSNWAGQPCGPRQTTVDLGAAKRFSKVVIWQHGTQHVPKTARVQYLDASGWHDVAFSRTYGAVTEDGTNAGYATSDEYAFAPVSGSKVRWMIDNCDVALDPAIGQLEHGWLYEFEVFDAVQPTVTSDTQLTADVGQYLAMTGGAATFGSIVPTIGSSSYRADATLQVSTSSATGVSVSVAPTTDVTSLGIAGANVNVAASEAPSLFVPLLRAGVRVAGASGPVNRAYTIPYRLDLAPGTVLRAGDSLSEPISYTATAALP